MSIQKLMKDTASYNNWVTKQYVDWLSRKSDEQLNQSLQSSFPTILATLHHIWTTQSYWVGKIMETDPFDFNNEIKTITKEEIFDGYIVSSEQLMTYISGLSEVELSITVKIEEEWFSCNFEKYQYLQHLINHGFYHRGQIVTMGRSIGITDAPMTDYNFFKVMESQNK